MADNLNILGAQFEDVTGIVATNTEEIDLLYTRGGGGTSTIDYDVVSTTDDSVVLADFVVESGTSDIWRYQKWASGKAECWTRKQITITAWNAWGSLYEASPTMPQFDFPANLFVVAPRLLVSTSGDMGLAGVESFHLTSTTQTTQIYALRPNATSTGGVVTFEYYAIGRWKQSWTVWKNNSFDTYTINNVSLGSVFTVMDNGNWAKSVSDGNNNNTSQFALSQRFNYADIKNKTCRFTWNIECDGVEQFDGTSASGNIGFGLFSNATAPAQPLSDRTSSVNIAPNSKFLGHHVEEFVLSELFAGKTEDTYFGWNIGFRSSTNNQTINILEIKFEVFE